MSVKAVSAGWTVILTDMRGQSTCSTETEIHNRSMLPLGDMILPTAFDIRPDTGDEGLRFRIVECFF